MKELKIGNKVYKVEYTIEASLCNECTEKVTNLMAGFAISETEDAKKQFISTIADIPQTTLSMFYAGLLEHHGEEADRTVCNKEDAKKLLKQYLSENKSSFYDLMEILIEEMENDGFFDLIGLTRIVKEVQTKEPKKPQDHKKKNAKVTEM